MNNESRSKGVMVMRGRKVLSMALLSAALMTGSCRSGDGAFGQNGWANRSVPLQVENHNFLDVTVYAVGAGASLRLGDVVGKGTGNFTIDSRKISMVGGLRLRVDPLGSARTFSTRLLFPDRTATVLLTVSAVLDQSYVTLR